MCEACPQASAAVLSSMSALTLATLYVPFAMRMYCAVTSGRATTSQRSLRRLVPPFMTERRRADLVPAVFD